MTHSFIQDSLYRVSRSNARSSPDFHPGGGGRGYSHCGLTVGLRVLPNGYQLALFVNHILPIGGTRFFIRN